MNLLIIYTERNVSGTKEFLKFTGKVRDYLKKMNFTIHTLKYESNAKDLTRTIASYKLTSLPAVVFYKDNLTLGTATQDLSKYKYIVDYIIRGKIKASDLVQKPKQNIDDSKDDLNDYYTNLLEEEKNIMKNKGRNGVYNEQDTINDSSLKSKIKELEQAKGLNSEENQESGGGKAQKTNFKGSNISALLDSESKQDQLALETYKLKNQTTDPDNLINQENIDSSHKNNDTLESFYNTFLEETL